MRDEGGRKREGERGSKVGTWKEGGHRPHDTHLQEKKGREGGRGREGRKAG